jgi:hypothetical protein
MWLVLSIILLIGCILGIIFLLPLCDPTYNDWDDLYNYYD